jgi:SPRY domain
MGPITRTSSSSIMAEFDKNNSSRKRSGTSWPPREDDDDDDYFFHGQDEDEDESFLPLEAAAWPAPPVSVRRSQSCSRIHHANRLRFSPKRSNSSSHFKVLPRHLSSPSLMPTLHPTLDSCESMTSFCTAWQTEDGVLPSLSTSPSAVSLEEEAPSFSFLVTHCPELVYEITSFLPAETVLGPLLSLGNDDLVRLLDDHFWQAQCRRTWPECSKITTPPGHDHVRHMITCLRLHHAAAADSSTNTMDPMQIDTTLLAPCRYSVRAGAYLPRHAASTTLKVSSGGGIYYTGPIGQGDRCFRTKTPWPVPATVLIPPSSPNNCSHMPRPLRFLPRLSAWSPTARLARAATTTNDHHDWEPLVRPFCLPYSAGNGGGMCLTPRWIAYYEVTIHASNQPTSSFAGSPECVAIGLSCAGFPLHGRMPGWDAQSFGYHSDDGGIFHASGHACALYGPTFGVGDVVGCGLDYAASAIFYTLNGQFLGYAFDFNQQVRSLARTRRSSRLLGMQLSPTTSTTTVVGRGFRREAASTSSTSAAPAVAVSTNWRNVPWYPTVGVDTSAVITCNFGQEPFVFDWQPMLQEQAASRQGQLQAWEAHYYGPSP